MRHGAEPDRAYPMTRAEWMAEATLRYVDATRHLDEADQGRGSYAAAAAHHAAALTALGFAAAVSPYPPLPRLDVVGGPPLPAGSWT